MCRPRRVEQHGPALAELHCLRHCPPTADSHQKTQCRLPVPSTSPPPAPSGTHPGARKQATFLSPPRRSVISRSFNPSNIVTCSSRQRKQSIPTHIPQPPLYFLPKKWPQSLGACGQPAPRPSCASPRPHPAPPALRGSSSSSPPPSASSRGPPSVRLLRLFCLP